jgi:hypothetical protein
VVIVVEGAARGGVAPCLSDEVEVVHAPGAGDDTMVALANAAGDGVVLVSADRALRSRVQASGGAVVGPAWLLARLA